MPPVSWWSIIWRTPLWPGCWTTTIFTPTATNGTWTSAPSSPWTSPMPPAPNPPYRSSSGSSTKSCPARTAALACTKSLPAPGSPPVEPLTWPCWRRRWANRSATTVSCAAQPPHNWGFPPPLTSVPPRRRRSTQPPGCTWSAPVVLPRCILRLRARSRWRRLSVMPGLWVMVIFGIPSLSFMPTSAVSPTR